MGVDIAPGVIELSANCTPDTLVQFKVVDHDCIELTISPPHHCLTTIRMCFCI